MKPTVTNLSQKFYIQNTERAFYVRETGCIAGQMTFTIGIADMVNKEKYFEFRFKSISEYHAIRSYDYEVTENSDELTVIVIDIDGDTLHLDSITLGKEKNYKLESRKGLDAESAYNSFPISPKNKLTHFALPGLYALFGHDVIFALPHEEFNTIIIRLNIPNEFYVFNESNYQTISVEEGTVNKIVYSDEKLSEFKAAVDAPAYYRDLEGEKENWENKLKKKPLKKKK